MSPWAAETLQNVLWLYTLQNGRAVWSDYYCSRSRLDFSVQFYVRVECVSSPSTWRCTTSTQLLRSTLSAVGPHLRQRCTNRAVLLFEYYIEYSSTRMISSATTNYRVVQNKRTPVCRFSLWRNVCCYC